eukprot:9555736-Ditylum_brightwellii.AAC.1
MIMESSELLTIQQRRKRKLQTLAKVIGAVKAIPTQPDSAITPLSLAKTVKHKTRKKPGELTSPISSQQSVATLGTNLGTSSGLSAPGAMGGSGGQMISSHQSTFSETLSRQKTFRRSFHPHVGVAHNVLRAKRRFQQLRTPQPKGSHPYASSDKSGRALFDKIVRDDARFFGEESSLADYTLLTQSITMAGRASARAASLERRKFRAAKTNAFTFSCSFHVRKIQISLNSDPEKSYPETTELKCNSSRRINRRKGNFKQQSNISQLTSNSFAKPTLQRERLGSDYAVVSGMEEDYKNENLILR